MIPKAPTGATLFRSFEAHPTRVLRSNTIWRSAGFTPGGPFSFLFTPLLKSIRMACRLPLLIGVER
jgi:hypothetical protein